MASWRQARVERGARRTVRTVAVESFIFGLRWVCGLLRHCFFDPLFDASEKANGILVSSLYLEGGTMLCYAKSSANPSWTKDSYKYLADEPPSSSSPPTNYNSQTFKAASR
ncbi:hypothetical protein E6O75_ATG03332 [Venturia nashicola]|uniref:Uncharacterized protein n=1 Tax=Venturia nashicola TaxID=86259 RepID=A0A4Z1PES4_9PEZI|nr:hypothetical protein E6O75_ATG03332 [Venturia nashicola]